ncbi:MAG: reverse transcriptase family protein [Sedimenticola sp.]
MNAELLKVIACMSLLIIALWFSCLALNLSGDIHPNPGPSSTFSDSDASTCSFEYIMGLFSVYHVNIQSLVPKLDIIEQEIQFYDVAVFTETWLNDTVLTDSISISNYSPPYRSDRQGRIGGGVAIYVRDSLTAIRRHDLEVPSLEVVWVEVKVNSKNILIGGFYRPPNAKRDYLDCIHMSIDRAKNSSINDIIILGDFNLNVLKQNDNERIEDIALQFGLHQLIRSPTHFTEHSSSLIDLMFVNKAENVIYSAVGDPFLPNYVRYHCPIFAVFKFVKPKMSTYRRTIWKYNVGDYEKLRSILTETDWSYLSDESTIDNKCNSLTSTILNAASESIPNKTALIRPTDKPWVTGHIRKLIRQRKRLYRKAKRTNTITNWAKFRTKRNLVIAEIKKAKTKYNDDLALKLKSNDTDIKLFWKISKQLLNLNNTQRSLPTLEYNGNSYESDIDKASLLNDYFITQSTVDDTQSDPLYPSVPTNIALSSFNITPTDIIDVLSSLNTSKASGPDLLHPRILKEARCSLAVPLSIFFNSSVSSGTFPSQWKQANVVPVFKKEDHTLPSNYRPISLLSCLGKVMERCVHKYLYNYISTNNLLTSFQSGFIPGDSTTNQLLSIYHTFCEAVDEGKEVRVVFFDISKAFDRVWHKGLIHKLRNIGINGTVLSWLENYLSDRQQRVVINGQSSDWKNVTAGVPQGSILGPLLFLIYINDIVNNIQSNIRLFADDTSLFIIVDDPVDSAQTLNNDLSTVQCWANKWLVRFNPTKTVSLLFSLKHQARPHTPLVFNDTQIVSLSTHKHLGVTLSSTGDWHDHISNITKVAWQRLNILRGLKFRIDRLALEKMYLSFIRPLLEYSSVIWDNCTDGDKQKLENIQVEAARIVTGCTKLCSLNNLYKETGWQTLQTRRDQQKLIMLYKMKNELVPPYLSNLLPQQVGNTTNYPLRNADHYQLPHARTAIYYQSFLPTTVRQWNTLDSNIRDSPSLSTFKSRIRGSPPDIPPYYYDGNRMGQIMHTRLRTECSSLNDQLFRKNLVISPLCNCGSVETTYHFLFTCTRYSDIRNLHFNSLPHNVNERHLLSGIPGNSYEDNKNMFLTVQAYILDTKRFSSHT